ncbi:MAG: iron ABC transporter permease [Pseudomonadota bacterium]
MTQRYSLLTLLPTLLCISLAAVALAMTLGSDGFRPTLAGQWLAGSLGATDNTLVTTLRLPRALSAFAVGGLLSLCGVLMQVLLRNPLADPYILGTSSGAASAALLAMLLGASGYALDLAAFSGACLATLIVFGIGGLRGGFRPAVLLLTGVVIATGFGALVSLMLALSDDATLRGMLFWLMGDFSLALHPAPILSLLVVSTIAVVLLAPHLNVLAENETRAKLLGLSIVQTRIAVLLLASLLCAFAVTQAGSIGFVGLVVPHLMRRFTGADHRRLVPAAMLAGGALLCVADTLSRAILAPRQLPVGVLTAAVGVPLFLYLLKRHSQPLPHTR